MLDGQNGPAVLRVRHQELLQLLFILEAFALIGVQRLQQQSAVVHYVSVLTAVERAAVVLCSLDEQEVQQLRVLVEQFVADALLLSQSQSGVPTEEQNGLFTQEPSDRGLQRIRTLRPLSLYLLPLRVPIHQDDVDIICAHY